MRSEGAGISCAKHRISRSGKRFLTLLIANVFVAAAENYFIIGPGALAAMPMPTRKKKSVPRIFEPDRWDEWSAHLASRPAPLPPWKRISSGRRSPLSWSCPPGAVSAPARGLLGNLERWMRAVELQAAEVARHLEPWLRSAGERAADADFAIECLGWSYLLPRLAKVLPAAPWCEVLDCLTRLSAEKLDSQNPDEPLVSQLRTGELPWTLADQFPELSRSPALSRAAGRRLSDGVRELLADNGLPHCRHVDQVRPLLACWTRCLKLVRADGGTCFDASAQQRYERFVRQVLQLSRQNGGPVFSANGAGRQDAELMGAALEVAGREEELAIADQLLPWRAASREASAQKVFFPTSSVYSESAQLASFRPTWLRGGEHLVVGHHKGAVRTELNFGSTTVWSGDWPVRVRVGDQLLQPNAWEEVCWHSDDDVDYLELETKWNGSWRLQRQILLAREDHFLWLADALTGPEIESLEYRGVLPLAPGIEFRPEQATHEGCLTHRQRVARVLPLALPEWRSAAATGSLEAAPGGLLLRQHTQARALYAPLFIDLSPHRLKWPLTWRQLTVGEKLQIQKPDVAVGYRVQVGGDQWLFYRSLAAPASRTLLGQNVLHEFYAARFDTEGEADELLAIDPAGTS